MQSRFGQYTDEFDIIVKKCDWTRLQQLLGKYKYSHPYNLETLKALVIDVNDAPNIIRHLAYLNLVVQADLSTVQEYSAYVNLLFYDPKFMQGHYPGKMLGGFDYDVLDDFVGRKDNFDCAVLPLALRSNRIDIFNYLYNQLSTLYHEDDVYEYLLFWGIDCVRYAIEHNQVEALKLFKESCQKWTEEFWHWSWVAGKSIIKAIESGHEEVINLLINPKEQGWFELDLLSDDIDPDPIQLSDLVKAALVSGSENMLNIFAPLAPTKVMGFDTSELNPQDFTGEWLKNPKFVPMCAVRLLQLVCEQNKAKAGAVEQFLQWLKWGLPFVEIIYNNPTTNQLGLDIYAKILSNLEFLFQACIQRKNASNEDEEFAKLPDEFDELIYMIEKLKVGYGRKILADNYTERKNYAEAFENYVSIANDDECMSDNRKEAKFQLASFIFSGEVILNYDGTVNEEETAKAEGLSLEKRTVMGKDASIMEMRSLQAYEYLYNNDLPEACRLFKKVKVALLNQSLMGEQEENIFSADLILEIYAYYQAKNPNVLADKNFATALKAHLSSQQLPKLGFFNQPAVRDVLLDTKGVKRKSDDANLNDDEHKHKRLRKE